MQRFDGLEFDGTFRPYQQEVLDNAKQYLKDGKAHIVAAPGAGKTVLGLELIRRLGQPALILSPTVTIRQQWTQRFCTHFLPDGSAPEDYVSEDIRSPKLLTSVTYQALYCAIRGLKDEEQDELSGRTERVDYAGVDFSGIMRRNGIRTVCLDEAHHLHSEWYRALRELLSEKQVTVIALTATPPYDSEPSEWKKYTELCGEIDFEIIAPELVQAGSLCPHQDYIYFSYPTKEELEKVAEYYGLTAQALAELKESGRLDDVLRSMLSMPEEQLYRNARSSIAVCTLLSKLHEEPPRRLRKKLTLNGMLPLPRRENLEEALDFIAARSDLFTEEVSDAVYGIFLRRGLTDRRRIRLARNERLDRMLASSAGKLQSVARIAEHESAAAGDGLRMLVLTDFVRKETLPLIGTENELREISIVSLFESIRRASGADRRLAALSGSLVLVPAAVRERLSEIVRDAGASCSFDALSDTGYDRVQFTGGNKIKVRALTILLEEGAVHILVGTKSLLGEGWDSPCVNTLILASFVGSYVLSNQMRGRAIRTDARTPEKVSNIWHLATVEPAGVFEKGAFKRLEAKLTADKNEFVSADYDVLKRRFKNFWGPSYTEDLVTNGIERLDPVRPPYTRESFERTDAEMLARSSDRASVARQWRDALGKHKLSVSAELKTEARERFQLKKVVFVNMLFFLLCLAVEISVIHALVQTLLQAAVSVPAAIFGIALTAVVLFLMEFGLIRLLLFALVPKKTVRCLCESLFHTLMLLDKITSPTARVRVQAPKGTPTLIIELASASGREQELFAEAVNEMLSPVENPAYIILKKKSWWCRYGASFACPSALEREDRARVFCHELKKRGWSCEPVYTRSERGRKVLIKARRHSFANVNDPAGFSYRKKVKPSFR